MINRKKRLILSQADRKLEPFKSWKEGVLPEKGWIHTVRTALGMSLRQLGERINKPAQSVQDFEKREQNGTITLQSLREIARSLDLELVYVLLPKGGSLNDMVVKQARAKAEEIIGRTNTTMQLEEQGNSDARLVQAADEKARELVDQMPKFLWD